MKKILEWNLPIVTVSEANCSEHWSEKNKRHKLQKKWISIMWKKDKPKIPLPCVIKITRYGKKLLDSDNLPISQKYLRDELSNQMFPETQTTAYNKKTGKNYLTSGKGDNDPRITWKYDQELAPAYSVTISFFDPS